MHTDLISSEQTTLHRWMQRESTAPKNDSFLINAERAPLTSDSIKGILDSGNFNAIVAMSRNPTMSESFAAQLMYTLTEKQKLRLAKERNLSKVMNLVLEEYEYRGKASQAFFEDQFLSGGLPK